MDNWKTTIAGLITAVLSVLAAAGVAVPEILTKGETIGLIAGVGAGIIGILARDGNKAQ